MGILKKCNKCKRLEGFSEDPKSGLCARCAKKIIKKDNKNE